MYIARIKQLSETWIVAIASTEHEIVDYLTGLSEEMRRLASVHQIQIDVFPFIVIEHTNKATDSDEYFEYCSVDALQARVHAARQQRVKTETHVYFKYYYVANPYFQIHSEKNLMQYLRHTTVTNRVLDEPYEMSIFHEQIMNCAANYDVDGLDELFEKTKNGSLSTLELQDLAINGYDSLFWDMNYDHACGKLTSVGVSLLLPMVDKLEALTRERKWQHRSFALHIQLEEACKNNLVSSAAILEDTVAAFREYLVSCPAEKIEIHRLLSLSYRWMVDADASHAFQYWKKAVDEIYEAIVFSPIDGPWSSLLELIYMNFEQSEITAAQSDLERDAEKRMYTLENQLGTKIAYPLALAYEHLRQQLEWRKSGDRFPASIALHWTEHALNYNPENITRIDFYECAQFFHEIGTRLARVDFLSKAITIYERIISNDVDCANEIVSIVELLKQIAEIHLTRNETVMADVAMMRAIDLCKKHINTITVNRSAHLRYAQFMEYCYGLKGNIEKPTLPDLQLLAEKIELESEGYLSYPYILLGRIALFNHNEVEAITQFTKSLILHELCAEDVFDKLTTEFAESKFERLKDFLRETSSFMKEVRDGYYYDPKLVWKKMNMMSSEELLSYWGLRKEEIRSRTKIE
ncbi:hypothetical protein [Pseudochryseolinea flava]|nr:hypothetical protein [Pseudochryseolinea flava]